MADIKLKSFTIERYKSIKAIKGVEPHFVNILIRSNGAGKSNILHSNIQNIEE